ncbi:ABC transporter ATP-binding protein [Helicovermis profundi]|uniref:Dipeptide ABC transporter ATP-binding protein n=1 Tax=Helicovermis profundi TaxID=3065157 RepID=A0AAU9E8H1_9FIRM|nr:dipeptide ABC transporter ATP-binding protein [Clostridia bacterium S502]
MAAILEVKDLKKYFPIKKGGFFSKKIDYVKAVEDVSFTLNKGETLGVVGESGCGKSTTGRCILQLIKPTGGEVLFEGKNLVDLTKKELRNMRRDMQIIFQDPYASLNPRLTVGDTIMEPMKNFGIGTEKERIAKMEELLDTVGLSPYHAKRYPHEFSGGQRQRVGIARALSTNPKLVICDEPVSALDVSIQAQTINLLKDLQEKYNLTMVFIAHDLSVVKHISDRVAVMYLGSIVEISEYKDLYKNPTHPYTKALLSAIPVPNPKANKNRIILKGDIPSPTNPPKGCKFNTRCTYATDICRKEKPILREVSSEHKVACHNV